AVVPVPMAMVPVVAPVVSVVPAVRPVVRTPAAVPVAPAVPPMVRVDVVAVAGIPAAIPAVAVRASPGDDVGVVIGREIGSGVIGRGARVGGIGIELRERGGVVDDLGLIAGLAHLIRDRARLGEGARLDVELPGAR